MRLEQVIVGHLVQVLATVHATGKQCARRMVLQGPHVDAYMAGYQDALQAVAGALGIAEELNDAGMVTIDAAPVKSLPAQPAERAVICVPLHTGWQALTPTERKIAELLAEDSSNKQIAAQLTVELNTVKTHIHNLYKKLDVHARSQFLDWWAAQGFDPISKGATLSGRS